MRNARKESGISTAELSTIDLYACSGTQMGVNMKRRIIKKRIAFALVLAVSAISFAACGKQTENPGMEETKQESNGTEEMAQGVIELRIPHYKAGQNTGAKFFEPQVARFNEKYEGQYKIVIEQMPQESYSEKMKQLAQQEKLPALIEGGDPAWLNSYIIPNKKYTDLSSWLDERKELKDVLIKDSLEYATREGEVVGLPLAVSRPMGMFYNHTKYQPQKAIRDMTMDEYLEGLGDNKIALMTAENAWTTMLLYSALVAGEEGGTEILVQGAWDKITDYNNPIWIEAARKLQTIAVNHAASNSVGAGAADALNSFASSNASFVYSGPWTIAEFTEEGRDKWSNGFEGTHVSCDLYPGNIAIDNVLAYTWWIPSSVSEEEKEAAKVFMEFIYTPEELESYMLSEGGVAPNYTPSEKFVEKQKENKLLYELNSLVNSETVIVPPTEAVMPTSVAAQEFGKLLPKLFDGSFTPERFCEELTKKAQDTIQ